MAVRIVVDDHGLYQGQDAEKVLSSDVNQIYAVRERIRHCLGAAELQSLVLCMSSAIFRRFADLEGQPGLEVGLVLGREVGRRRQGEVETQSAAAVWR